MGVLVKVLIEFNLPEDAEEHETVLKAGNYRNALFDIRNLVFRPARKHGYSEEMLQNLTKAEVHLISKLEDLFNEILIDNEVDA